MSKLYLSAARKFVNGMKKIHSFNSNQDFVPSGVLAFSLSDYAKVGRAMVLDTPDPLKLKAMICTG